MRLLLFSDPSSPGCSTIGNTIVLSIPLYVIHVAGYYNKKNGRQM